MRDRWRHILILVAGALLVTVGCRRQDKDIFVGSRGNQTAYLRFVNLLSHDVRVEVSNKSFGTLSSRKATQFEPIRTGSIAAIAYEGPLTRIDGHVDMDAAVAYTLVVYPSNSASRCIAIPDEPQLSPDRRGTIRVVSLVDGGELVWASIVNSRARASLANSLHSFEGTVPKQVLPGTYRLKVRTREKTLTAPSFTINGGEAFTLFVWRDNMGRLQMNATENKTRWVKR